MNQAAEHILHRLKAGITEAFTRNKGLETPERSVDIDFRDALLAVLAAIFVRFFLIGLSAVLAGESLVPVIPISLISVAGDLVLYLTVIGIAFVAKRPDRGALLLFAVALANIMVLIIGFAMSYILDANAAITGAFLAIIYSALRNVLRIGILGAVVSSICIVGASFVVTLSLLFTILG